jgi:hypothetical protein
MPLTPETQTAILCLLTFALMVACLYSVLKDRRW